MMNLRELVNEGYVRAKSEESKPHTGRCRVYVLNGLYAMYDAKTDEVITRYRYETNKPV